MLVLGRAAAVLVLGARLLAHRRDVPEIAALGDPGVVGGGLVLGREASLAQPPLVPALLVVVGAVVGRHLLPERRVALLAGAILRLQLALRGLADLLLPLDNLLHVLLA